MTTEMEPRQDIVEVDGRRLNVREAGRGRPVLLITGIGCNVEFFAPFQDSLTGRRTIAFDAPGVGRSAAPDGPASIRYYATVAARLIETLVEEPVDVVGYSFGGTVAQQLAHLPRAVPGGAPTGSPCRCHPTPCPGRSRPPARCGAGSTRKGPHPQANEPSSGRWAREPVAISDTSPRHHWPILTAISQDRPGVCRPGLKTSARRQTMTDLQGTGVIPAGAVVTRDIPVGAAVTAADFGAGAEAAGPQEVHVGSGGDPLMIGIPIFVVGSLVLGIALIGTNPIPLAGMVPVILMATAFFQLVATIWAVLLGQGIVACIMGLFSGFWASLAALLLGLGHNWYGIPVASIGNEQLIFFIAWDVIFFFLLLIMLRLPAIYPAIMVLVAAAVTLVVIGIEFPGAATTLSQAAGACVIAFCALGMWVFMHIGSVSLGGPTYPPLGPALVK